MAYGTRIITARIRKGKYIHKFKVTFVPTDDGKKYKVYSPFDVALKDEIKAMQGARWPADQHTEYDKYWTIDVCERNFYAIQCLEGKVNRDVRSVDYTSSRDLFSHQCEGIRFILARRRVLLAFEMGLGKTLIGIEVLEHLRKTEHLANFWLVAPFGAQQEWKRQLKTWGTTIDFTVVSTYESLHKYMDALPDSMVPDVLIFDESIKIKNPAAKRSQVASELCRMVRAKNGHIIMLSGAPAPRDPIDWWNQVECLQPGFIRESNAYKFKERYANVVTVDHGYGPHKEVESWKQDEVKALGRRLSPIVMVRKKADCLDLPPKLFETIDCSVYLKEGQKQELMRMGEYLIGISEQGVGALQKLRELSDGFLYQRRTQDTTDVASVGEGDSDPTQTDSSVEEDDREPVPDSGRTGETYQRLQIRPKIEAVKELLDFYHRDNGGPGRLVIYAAFHASITMLKETVLDAKWTCVTITGKGWSDKDVLEYFNDDAELSNVCIIANPACVHGLTLTSTHALVYYSNSFSVDHRIQSLDRRDRPGMDKEKGTRIIDLCNLPTDLYIKDRLDNGIELQDLTLEEIKLCLSVSNRS